jgi:hypothetical protein
LGGAKAIYTIGLVTISDPTIKAPQNCFKLRFVSKALSNDATVGAIFPVNAF